VVLALGGGGVRGGAHTALLDVLTEAGIPVLGLAGSSAGAIAAAVYAFGLNTRPEQINEWLKDPELERLQRNGVFSQVARMVDFVRRPYLAEGTSLREGYKRIFDDHKIEHSLIPLIIQAADFHTGELVMLKAGSVAEALAASSAVPSVFPPVSWHGRLLVDGDVAEKVPVTAAKSLGLGPVVAVDISNPSIPAEPKSALEAALQAGEASRKRLLSLALAQADLVISLAPETTIETFDYTKGHMAYELGRKRAEEALPRIKVLIEETQPEPGKSRWLHWLKPRAQSQKSPKVMTHPEEHK